MRKPTCPIGLNCPKKPCRNYDQCKDLTYSWEIPYYIKDKALIVKEYGFRYDWREEAQGTVFLNRCTLPSGDYRPLNNSEHDSEMQERLHQSWLDAGWCAAIPLTEKPLPHSISSEPVEPPKETLKIETCPYCNSEQIYRKQRESLTLYCDNCGHSWQTDHCKYRGFEIKIGEKSFELPTEDGRILRFYYHCLLDQNIQEWGETETIDEALEKAKEDIDYLIDFY